MVFSIVGRVFARLALARPALARPLSFTVAVCSSTLQAATALRTSPPLAPSLAGMAAAMKDIKDAIKDIAGLTSAEVEYLTARGFGNVRIFARAAPSPELFITRVFTPYVQGMEIGGTMHKLDRDPVLAEASFVVAWEEAAAARTAELRHASEGAPLAALGPPGAYYTTAPQARTQSTLLPGDWQRQVDRWESQWTPKRTFPSKILQGSETVLARLLYEKDVTRQFTPLGLCDIVATRAYHYDGSVNVDRLERPKPDQALNISHAGEVYVDNGNRENTKSLTSWDANDAITSNLWALRWADLASDGPAEDFQNLLVKLIRSPDVDLYVFQPLYTSLSWRIAMAMREGASWDQASADLKRDRGWIDDQVQKLTREHRERRERRAVTPQRAPRGHSAQRGRSPAHRARSPAPSGRDHGGRQRSRSRQAQRASHKAPPKEGNYDRDKRARSVSRGGREYCKNFLAGKCKRKNCKYSHECPNCRKPGCAGGAGCTKSGNAGHKR